MRSGPHRSAPAASLRTEPVHRLQLLVGGLEPSLVVSCFHRDCSSSWWSPALLGGLRLQRRLGSDARVNLILQPALAGDIGKKEAREPFAYRRRTTRDRRPPGPRAAPASIAHRWPGPRQRPLRQGSRTAGRGSRSGVGVSWVLRPNRESGDALAWTTVAGGPPPQLTAPPRQPLPGAGRRRPLLPGGCAAILRAAQRREALDLANTLCSRVLKIAT